MCNRALLSLLARKNVPRAFARGLPARQCSTLDQVREAERAPEALVPAWRDPTGQGRDSLGRSTSPEELTRVADQAPAAVREVEAQKSYLRGAYRDPDQAWDALDS